MDSLTSTRTAIFWRLLDVLLNAYALSRDVDPEVASFAQLPIFVAAERLGLTDEVVELMSAGAVAEARRLGGLPLRLDEGDLASRQ